MNIEATLFVVDDDIEARDSVCALAESNGLKTESFASAEEFLAAYKVSGPACLVTDMRLPGMSGLDIAQELVNRDCAMPVVIISGYIGVKETVHAMKLGVETVLEKPYRSQELFEAIENGLQQAAQFRIDRAHRNALRNRLNKLSLGERKVLDLISTGAANKVVAKRLEISLRAVEDRRRRVMKKLGADSFARLMEFVFEAKRSDALASDLSNSSGEPLLDR